LQTKCVTVGLGGRRKVDPTSHHCEKFGLNSTKNDCRLTKFNLL
jgi:hypothetical protein